MEPKVVRAWSCGLCNHTYPHNEHGKRWAKACCTCKKCGGASTHTGINGMCKKCIATENLASARKHSADQQAYLKNCEDAARKLGIEV